MAGWRRMASLFLSDEELGKKDDDHKKSLGNTASTRSQHWHPARVPPRRSLKRFGILAVVAALVYLFVKNIPVLGPDLRMRRPNYAYPDHSSNSQNRLPPNSPPRSANRPSNAQERTFNGPVKFHELAASLNAITATGGGMLRNRNVLYAASSLKSAAMLLPIACRMGVELKNYVNFAFISRSDIELDELLKVNGIDPSCHIIFHDARPEYAQISTNDRMENAVFRAFHHINTYMHPQVIMVDGSSDEEGFFLRGVRQHVQVSKNTLVELPRTSAKTLRWMTKLDSAALRMWDKNHIDILIHATRGASGSLIRLLRSLSKADYTSTSVPHLTIELPHDIDPPTKKFLETFSWPPAHVHNPTNVRYLSLRHRIPHQALTEEESSARFLESFWPARPQNSHILVLSPQVELSPHFFHYLKYSLLEYRYSAISTFQEWDRRLLGISLAQPLELLYGDEGFSPPTLKENLDTVDETENDVSTPFLWQAPTSNAVLFLGEKWVELHDFVSRSLEVQQISGETPTLLAEKVVDTKYPSWLEHALRLARARGYWTLYPGEDAARNLANVHRELPHFPEEYSSRQETSKAALPEDASEEEIERVRQKIRSSAEISLVPVSLLESLPRDGNLRPFGDLPVVTWDGRTTDVEQLNNLANAYTSEFRKEVGGCAAVEDEEGPKHPPWESMSARDLFCTTD